MTISIIIPTLNESRWIAQCLGRIHQVLGDPEVIVVDRGSSDGTAEIASGAGARVIHGEGSVGCLRNLGAKAAGGDALVFVDADVMLLPEYQRGLADALDEMQARPRALYGLNYGVRPNATWVERLMFDPATVSVRHIPAGNMVMARSFFQELGGFDEALPTGEDYDFVSRVRKAGGEVREVPSLAVIHEGYPRTVWHFMRREAWIGMGDFGSLRAVASSRVALLTIAFLVLHLGLLLSLLAGAWLFLLCAAALLGLCVGVTLFKGWRPPLRDVPALLLLWYLYFWGRAGAAYKAILAPDYLGPKGKRARAARPPAR